MRSWSSLTLAAFLLACLPRVAAPPTSAPISPASPTATTAPPPSSAPVAGLLGPMQAARGGALTVRFLDVGQGDSALLTTSDHHALLVDAGPADAGPRVASALASLGRDSLDAVVLSHAHADHLGALDALARSIPLERWIDPGYAPHAVAAYPRALAALEARHVPIVAARRGDRFALGAHVEVTILEPRAPLFSHTRSDLNANSVVLRVVHHARGGDVRVLFEGDAEHATEERLLADGPLANEPLAHEKTTLAAEVLKVAHHGSRHASSAAMLDAVSPRLAVISCGLGNDYGHPHAKTLRRLEAHHAVVARTDLEGDVTVTSDDSGLRWAVAREVPPADLRVPGLERAEAP